MTLVCRRVVARFGGDPSQSYSSARNEGDFRRAILPSFAVTLVGASSDSATSSPVLVHLEMAR
jgi:hypothetical protein